MGKILLPITVFTLSCACWLALMESLLRHPGFEVRIGVALAVALICLATIVARMLRVGLRAERWLWVGAGALIALGGEAFFHNARAAHFEGFVFVISLALVLQGLTMIATLGRQDSARPHSA